jgi:hypothetical protein
LTISKDEPKSAGGLLASEALRIVPENQKQIAGQGFGGALANIGAALEDVTMWVRVVAAVPRGMAQFVARVTAAWRQTPAHRRLAPKPELLLTAATGYANQEEDELREKYVRLIVAAVDSESAPFVHPAFASIIAQMTPVEARLFDFFRTGGYFTSFDALSKAAGVQLDEDGIQLAMASLDRLGLVDDFSPKIEPESANTPEVQQLLVKHGGAIIVEEKSALVLDPNDKEHGTVSVTRSSRKVRTSLGAAFEKVCGGPR